MSERPSLLGLHDLKRDTFFSSVREVLPHHRPSLAYISVYAFKVYIDSIFCMYFSWNCFSLSIVKSVYLTSCSFAALVFYCVIGCTQFCFPIGGQLGCF
jgi:hypothetical protein